MHRELAGAQDASARPNFITVLGLNLVQPPRKRLIGSEIALGQNGCGNFVSWRHTHFSGVAIVKGEHIVTEYLITSGLFPDTYGLDSGKDELFGTPLSHLLPYNLFESPAYVEEQGKLSVNTRSELANHTCPDHEGVANLRGIARRITERRNEYF
jgi:hypothetical protein